MIKTSDMYLAAMVLSYGSRLSGVDRRDQKRQIFEFDCIPTSVFIIENGMVQVLTPKTLDELKILMLAEKLMFPPAFINAVKTVKSCLHDE